MTRQSQQPKNLPVTSVSASASVSLKRGLICTLISTLFMSTAMAASDTADKDADAIAELTRPQSRIEIGAGGISEASFAAGNLIGIGQKDNFLIGNFDLRGSQYSYGNSSDDKTRWRLTGTNVGLDSRSLTGEYGRQGKYRITFGYDEIPRFISDSYQTPFQGGGSANLTLPNGFVRGADTRAMSTLASSMQRFDVEVKRQQSEIGLSYWLTREWELRASLRNDDRDGTRIRGVEFGSNGGNPRAMLLPEPINSSTQLIDASIAFNGDSHRFTISYHGSLFRNDISAVTFQNPYTSAAWVGGTSGLVDGFPLPNGQIGVAPDNQFHQLAASGSYDFSSTTRLTLTGSRGRMTQNEAFLPYTVNPGLSSTALPRTSLNGLVETTFFNARLAVRPMRNFSVSGSLRYEDRDNKTPMSEYIYIGGDIQLQPQPGSASDRIRTNLPRSRQQIHTTLDADLRISPTITLKTGWDHDAVKRTFAEVERATENTYRMELRQGSMGAWTASASYALLVRRGTQYLYNLPYLSSYTSVAFINSLAAANGCTVLIDCIRAGPLQNKFYLADRDRERARLMIGFMPNAAISLQARVDVNRDKYPHSPYGIIDANSWSAGADLGYIFNDDISTTLFIAVEDQRSRERTRQILSANTSVASNAAADWENQFIDKSTSVGFGMRYKGLLGGKLELNADAFAVRGRTPIATTAGSATPTAQNPATAFPDLIARSEHINFSASYAMDRRSTIRLNYFYRRLNSADWAYQQVDTTTLANVIGSKEIPAHFSVHGIGVSYVRSFR